MEPFLFYPLTLWDEHGAHLIGYFSKEKASFLNYNLSCILTLPHHQRKGYGKLLIEFSYMLSMRESKIGTPEKPLSDLGLVSYRAYWTDVILGELEHHAGSEITLQKMSERTAISMYDIISTLQSLGMIKYWRGKHVIIHREDLFEDYRHRMAAQKGRVAIGSASAVALRLPMPCRSRRAALDTLRLQGAVRLMCLVCVK